MILFVNNNSGILFSSLLEVLKESKTYIVSGNIALLGTALYKVTIYRNVIELYPGVLQENWIFDSPTDRSTDGEFGKVPAAASSQSLYSSPGNRVTAFISSQKDELNVISENTKIFGANSKLVVGSLNDSGRAEVAPESDSKVEDKFEGESGTKKILVGTSSTN